MHDAELTWTWRGAALRVGLTRAGSGPTILLLPALSSISTRREMQPLQQRLATRFATISLDWPGFGDLPRPRAGWGPPAYAAFLAHLAGVVAPQLHATVAAGHAAGYALGQAAAAPGSLGRLCLVAPTWRGPLPTMLGRRHPALARVAGWVDRPLLGPLLYRLNVNRLTLGMMARGHVYADSVWLTGERLAQKRAVARSPGARYASIRFVTGALDPVQSRQDFLELAERVRDPVQLVVGAATPRKSLAEMDALAALPTVKAVRLPAGKLAVHEEFPEAVFAAITPFLN